MCLELTESKGAIYLNQNQCGLKHISFGVTIYENNCIKLILFHFFMPDKVINNEIEED